MMLAMVLGVVLGAGCSRYATVATPWTGRPSTPEFTAGASVQVGDRARITTRDARMLEGPIVALDSLAVTLLMDSGAGNVQVIPATDVVRFEKYAGSSWRPIRTAALVVGGSLAAYWFVDELTKDDIFSPEPDTQR